MDEEKEMVIFAKLRVITGENAHYGYSQCDYCEYILKDNDSRTECAECGAIFEELKHEPYDFGGSDF